MQLPANTILFRERNFNIADAALLGLKNTDLVVLSACQTAVQTNSNGEEFAGIAYLFERAGARSVIASLWLAKDEETRDLMIAFYQNLKKGMTKGEALRQAKLSGRIYSLGEGRIYSLGEYKCNDKFESENNASNP